MSNDPGEYGPESWTLPLEKGLDFGPHSRRLLQDAKATLSPQEFATVEKWFAHEINEQLNRQVVAAALAGTNK